MASYPHGLILMLVFLKVLFLVPLLFLVYINDLPDNLVGKTQLFADDTSMFPTGFDITRSSKILNQDLCTNKNWAYQWKMEFNPDRSKQATEVIFYHKINKVNHPNLYFNASPVRLLPFKNILGYF